MLDNAAYRHIMVSRIKGGVHTGALVLREGVYAMRLICAINGSNYVVGGYTESPYP